MIRKGTGSSWEWSSILERRAIIANEGVSIIGKGELVHVFYDSSLPKRLIHRLHARPSEAHQQNIKAAQLIDSVTNQWNLDPVRGIITTP